LRKRESPPALRFAKKDPNEARSKQNVALVAKIGAATNYADLKQNEAQHAPTDGNADRSQLVPDKQAKQR
jgi:hypothetical protein